MRINIIPAETLTDVHLRAEFREIVMSVHYYKRSLKSPKGIDTSKISDKYTLNAGHAMMWYNKFGFIKSRFFELASEMKKRNFEYQYLYENFLSAYDTYIPQELASSTYNVTEDDLYINLERILTKIFIKPYGFYKLYGESFGFLEWSIFYTEKLNLDKEKMYYMIRKIEGEWNASFAQ